MCAGQERLAGTKVLASSAISPEVLSFHGSGAAANRSRVRYILDYLASRGMSSLCFDFSGHGESTGRIEQGTLATRRKEAEAAAELLNPGVSPVLIGTSMGGYIAALLAPVIQPRSLILFCPAAYSAETMHLRFDENFTSITRRPGAYINSPAFQGLRSYRGKLLIVAGGKDAIIPREVIALYEESAPLTRFKETLWLEESDHKIHSWLADHLPERTAVLEKVLAAA